MELKVTYLQEKLDADGESGHVDGEFAIGDPTVVEVDDDAVLVDHRRTQTHFGHQTHRPHTHFLRITHL